jgi:hypothetical protein
MLHKAIINSEQGQTFEYLMDAVSFCNTNADPGDTCSIVESYESLTGIEDHVTIMAWVFQREYGE